MSSRPELKVHWCSHEAARYAVEHWHYSGALPTAPYVLVGAWENGEFIGVVWFSRGNARDAGKAFGLGPTEIAEVTRIALREHATPVSRILSIAVKFLKARCPGIRLLVSFADPNHGHHGGIYQAAGWVYVGQTEPGTAYLAPDGKVWHHRMVSVSGRMKVYGEYRAVWKPEQCEAIPLAGKLKYLLPIDDEMRALIEPMRKPYPKRERVRGADSGTAASSSRGRCETTRTLHFEGVDGERCYQSDV